MPPGRADEKCRSPSPHTSYTASESPSTGPRTYICKTKIPQEILICKVCKIWSNKSNLSPLFSYENFQAYRKIQRNLSEYQRTHYLDSTTDVYYTWFTTYLSTYLFPSPSSHPSLSGRFSCKLQASAHSPLNTTAGMVLTRAQYLFVVFFFWGNIYRVKCMHHKCAIGWVLTNACTL